MKVNDRLSEEASKFKKISHLLWSYRVNFKISDTHCPLKNKKNKSLFLDSKSTVKMCEKKLETQRKKMKDKCDTTDCCWHICIKPSLILTKCYYHCILLLSYYFTVLLFDRKESWSENNNSGIIGNCKIGTMNQIRYKIAEKMKFNFGACILKKSFKKIFIYLSYLINF